MAWKFFTPNPGLIGSWVDYVPVWTSSGTAPALGNGTSIARYSQMGKFVVYQGKITFGSSTTFGTGTYFFSMPVTRGASAIAGAHGIVDLLDVSTGNRGLGVGETPTNSTFQVVVSTTYFGAQTAITNTAPWTWATGDVLLWNLIYEAA